MRTHNDHPITSPDDVRIGWPEERGTGIYIAVALTLSDDDISHVLVPVTVRRGASLDREARARVFEYLHHHSKGALIMQMTVYPLGVETIKQVYPFADLRLSTDFAAGEESERAVKL